MEKRIKLALAGLIILAALTLLASGRVSAFAGGNGTLEDPYQISNVTELQEMNTILWANYTLANDFDASATAAWNAGAGFDPVGNATDRFIGRFDGRGHSIHNLTINRPSTDYIGLFGYTDGGAWVRNLVLADLNLTGGQFVGGLIGMNNASIINCSVTGVVNSSADVLGGLVGYHVAGNIFDCACMASVGGQNVVGGMAGYFQAGTISNCFFSGQVSGISNLGGLVAYVTQATITSCHTSGSINGTGFLAGGFVGRFNGGSIMNCFSTCNVGAPSNVVGGFAGSIAGGTVMNCYSTGIVSGDWMVGGFAGQQTGLMINCFSFGNVSGTGRVGGFAGLVHQNITSCASSGNVSGTGSELGGFAGENQGTITRCSSSGDVDGNPGTNVGGLVGLNSNIITFSHCTGHVVGDTGVGGFAGTNDLHISNCSARGDVVGNYSAGGFVGTNSGPVEDCFSVGHVTGIATPGGFAEENTASIDRCYWDTQTSGQPTSAGGTGKTTTEMKQSATFSGWNFTGVWSIVEDVDYPNLETLGQMPIVTTLQVTLDNWVEGSAYQVFFQAALSPDPVSTTMAGWNIVTNAGGWLSISLAGPSISATPTTLEIGSYFINVSCTDSSGRQGWLNFTLTVVPSGGVIERFPTRIIDLNGNNWTNIGWTDKNTTASVLGRHLMNQTGVSNVIIARWNQSAGNWDGFLAGISSPDFDFNVSWGIGYFIWLDHDTSVEIGGMGQPGSRSSPSMVRGSRSGGTFGGGNGTASNPYLIEDIDDLQAVSLDLNANYSIVNDIDASETSTWNSGAGFVPLGNATARFNGTLDGQNHSITNLTINRPTWDYVGLFGSTGTGAAIRDVAVINGNEPPPGTTSGSYPGGILAVVSCPFDLINSSRAGADVSSGGT